jgi:ADYC domain-containing protein/beta-galactosidase-like protein
VRHGRRRETAVVALRAESAGRSAVSAEVIGPDVREIPIAHVGVTIASATFPMTTLFRFARLSLLVAVACTDGPDLSDEDSIGGQSIGGQSIGGQSIGGQSIGGQGTSGTNGASGTSTEGRAFSGAIINLQFPAGYVLANVPGGPAGSGTRLCNATSCAAPTALTGVIRRANGMTFTGTEGDHVRVRIWSSQADTETDGATIHHNTFATGNANPNAVVGSDDTNTDVLLVQVQYDSTSNLGTNNWTAFCPGGGRNLDGTDDGRGTGWSVFLQGTWDLGGNWRDSTTEFTVACDDGTYAKCARQWGYRPWRTAKGVDGVSVKLDKFHRACTRAARADYCLNGTSYTKTGTIVDLFDTKGFNAKVNEAVRADDIANGKGVFAMESIWSAQAATGPTTTWNPNTSSWENHDVTVSRFRYNNTTLGASCTTGFGGVPSHWSQYTNNTNDVTKVYSACPNCGLGDVSRSDALFQQQYIYVSQRESCFYRKDSNNNEIGHTTTDITRSTYALGWDCNTCTRRVCNPGGTDSLTGFSAGADYDPSCCSSAWGSSCVAKANQYCGTSSIWSSGDWLCYGTTSSSGVCTASTPAAGWQSAASDSGWVKLNPAGGGTQGTPAVATAPFNAGFPSDSGARSIGAFYAGDVYFKRRFVAWQAPLTLRIGSSATNATINAWVNGYQVVTNGVGNQVYSVTLSTGGSEHLLVNGENVLAIKVGNTSGSPTVAVDIR